MVYNNHNGKNHKFNIAVGLLLWFVLAAICYLVVFKTMNFTKLPHTIPMLILVFISFLLSLYITKEVFRFPKLNRPLTLAFVILIAYVLLLTIFATFRIYYSRSFILFSILINYIIAYLLLVSPYKKLRPKFILLYPENSIREQELKDHGIEFTSDLSENGGGYSGIIIKDFSVISPEISEIITRQVFRGTPLFSFAEIYSSVTGKIPLESFKPELLRTSGITAAYRLLKRLLEKTICFICFMPAFIIGAIISLLIIIESGFPVFFIQERVGYKGKTFRLIKFRTMVKNAESNGPAFANNNDNRITRIGKILRKLRLDELPQIINVIRGDMSLIGPRPEQIPFAREFEKKIPYYSLRYNLRPGLTGWAQIHSGYAANLNQTKEKLEYDLYYLFNQSIFLDIVIIFKTIKIILTGHGAL